MSFIRKHWLITILAFLLVVGYLNRYYIIITAVYYSKNFKECSHNIVETHREVCRMVNAWNDPTK
jgi:hypothetical protein